MNYIKFLTISLFVLLLSVTGNNAVKADEAVTSSGTSSVTSSLGLEEIIVTARKREESLLDIPETVVAISGKTISRQNIKNLDKIGMSVPNLNLNTRADGWPNVTMRGMGAFSLTQGVGFYLDDEIGRASCRERV